MAKKTTNKSGKKSANNKPKNDDVLKDLGYNQDSFADAMQKKKIERVRQGKPRGGVIVLILGVVLLGSAIMNWGGPNARNAAIVGGVLVIYGIASKLTEPMQAKKIKIYEEVINPNGNTSIFDIAAAVGKDEDWVAVDLQRLMAQGFLPGAYLDVENMLLVMTEDGEAIEDVEASAEENKKARMKAARAKGEVPQTVEELIVVTDDEDIQSKLKALQSIAECIDERAEAYPKMAKDVKKYNDVFLPEVVRLTDAYNEKVAKLATAEQASEEFNAGQDSLTEQAEKIKQELIKLIDNIVEASENLLAKLHEDEMLDITTDIKAIQAKIASEGLLDSDFNITV